MPIAFKTMNDGYQTDKLGFLKRNVIFLSVELLDLRPLTGELQCVGDKIQR